MVDARVVGGNIHFLRRQRAWSQQKLADILCVSHQAVSKWEKGITLPDVQTILNMSRLFGITMEALLTHTLLSAGRQTANCPPMKLTAGL